MLGKIEPVRVSVQLVPSTCVDSRGASCVLQSLDVVLDVRQTRFVVPDLTD